MLHIITSLNDGGAESVLYRLVTQDRQNEHHVVSLTGAGKYGPWFQQASIGVTTLGMPRGRVTWQGLVGLRRAIATFQPDIVQTWMYHADLLGGLVAKTPGSGRRVGPTRLRAEWVLPDGVPLCGLVGR